MEDGGKNGEWVLRDVLRRRGDRISLGHVNSRRGEGQAALRIED